MRVFSATTAAALILVFSSCKKAEAPAPGSTEALPPPTRVTDPAAPTEAPEPGEASAEGTAPEGSSAERLAEDETTGADEPAPSAQQNTFDRQNLRRHSALLAFVRKARARLDQAAQEGASKGEKGKAAAIKDIQRLQEAQQSGISSQSERLRQMDPEGTLSALTADHQMNLQFLVDEYPASLVGLLSGDEEPITEVRSEMDRLEKRIEERLTKLRQAK